MKVELTKSQCDNLAEWIELHLLESIRDDEDIDNILWLKDMVLAWEALKMATLLD